MYEMNISNLQHSFTDEVLRFLSWALLTMWFRLVLSNAYSDAFISLFSI